MLAEDNLIWLLDGAMGTQLQQMQLMSTSVPEAVNLIHPDAIRDIHRAYIQAGAQIIYSNTFSLNRYKLENSGYTVSELVQAAIRNAQNARKAEQADVLIALDCGPIGKMLQPNGDLTFEEAYDMFKEIVIAGTQAGADLILFETFTDLLEIKAAVLAAKENSSLPVFASMSFEANGRTFAGVNPASAALTLTGLGVDALGVNCSLGPEQIMPVAQEMAAWTNLPLLIKPNAGLPDVLSGEFKLNPAEFAESAAKFAEIGVKFIGGCCGTTPAHIRALSQKLAGKKVAAREIVSRTAICSAETVAEANRVRVVGERINPTGKKRFKAALEHHDIPYILSQALEQTEAGAEILDVNLGVPGIDEAALMREVIPELQSVTTVPLQIDSSDPAAIEAALRIYNGKALVNSVNGERQNLEKLLPIVKKYGAAVIGLTLDENGLPKTAEERVRIAKKIVAAAAEFGIPAHDVVIDCLTLTVSAQQDQAIETLAALKTVRHTLGLHTVLGVSNVSFGLPDRETINAAFLAMALANGLDLPILNPNNRTMMDTVRAFNVLSNRDTNAEDFIRTRSDAVVKTVMPESHITLEYAIENGLRKAAGDAARTLLETQSPSEVIDNILIPTLEKVGNRFEKGEIFLPQLIQAAGAAQSCFEIVKTKLAKSENQNPDYSRGKIILATVQGDIHDIGKNIVRVILENSGYQIVDLGKDVKPEVIVEAVEKEQVKLVGLSALMTTSVKSMAETIRQLKQVPGCKVMVGGAVLTESFAKSIGADYYGKDAKSAMDIAKTAFDA